MKDSLLRQVEMARYERHFSLPELGITGQQKLKNSSVLVIGAGGLGCAMLSYLVAAGVGNIGIIDDDVVDITNLQRQVLYTTADIGQPKVEIARERLLALNPHVHIDIYTERFTSANAAYLVNKYDVVADGSDNFPTRYLVNDSCVIAEKPYVFASVYRYEGHLAVFNYYRNGAKGINYRDIFPTPPPPTLVPTCAEGGVLGVLPGIVGAMQANEVIKLITNIGEPLADRLCVFDAHSFNLKTLKTKKNTSVETITKLINYDLFCETGVSEVPEVSIFELKEMLNDVTANFQFIDVRETTEYAHHNLGGILIPLSTFGSRARFLSRDRPMIVVCKSGKRSANAVAQLQQLGFDSVYSVKGGIDAYDRIFGD